MRLVRQREMVLRRVDLLLAMVGLIFGTLVCVPAVWARQGIPTFTPNVVDLTGALAGEETQEINEAIAKLKSAVIEVHAAVYITESLEGETIESLAERAFRQWQLGKKGVDNGLLLVVAMRDRRMRLEVGYGLEGVLTDALCKRILDERFRPEMRAGRLKQAILSTFAEIPQSEAALKELQERLKKSDPENRLIQPEWVWGIWVLFCVTIVPLRRHYMRVHARQLELRLPLYRMEEDRALKPQIKTPQLIFVMGFLSINPGIFFMVFTSIFELFAGVFIALLSMLVVVLIRRAIRPYRSPEAYLAHVEAQRIKYAKWMKTGDVTEGSFGQFRFSENYIRSNRSSGGSSSSGGGSSGGGGASSSW